MTEISKRIVTANVIAERLGVNVRTVWRWAREGSVPHLRIGRLVRFDLDEVEAAMEDAARAA